MSSVSWRGPYGQDVGVQFPLAPFGGNRTAAMFYERGGTGAQYATLMSEYYSAYQAAIAMGPARGTPVSTRSSSPQADFRSRAAVSRASSLESMTQAVAAHRGAAMPARVLSAVNASRPTSPVSTVVGMSALEYESLWKSKQAKVDFYGPGYCYLYAVRNDRMADVARECLADAPFREILKFASDFESDAYLAKLTVEVEGNVAHVAPDAKFGTKFLTLCRSILPDMASREFVERMRAHGPTAAVFVQREDFRIGGLVGYEQRLQDNAAERHARWFDDHYRTVVQPDVETVGASPMKFTELEVSEGHEGLVLDAPVTTELVVEMPGGFSRGFVHCPPGMSVRHSGEMVSGDSVVPIYPGLKMAVRVDKPVTQLWLDVITDGRPCGVVRREPVDEEADRRVRGAIAAYVRRMGMVACGSFSRGGDLLWSDNVGGVVVRAFASDGSQSAGLAGAMQKSAVLQVENGSGAAVRAALEIQNAARVVGHNGLGVSVVFKPRLNARLPGVTFDHQVPVVGLDADLGILMAVASPQHAGKSLVYMRDVKYEAINRRVVGAFVVVDKSTGNDVARMSFALPIVGSDIGRVVITGMIGSVSEVGE